MHPSHPLPPSPLRRVQIEVGFEEGTCSFCEAEDVDVIAAFDPRIYSGRACTRCVLLGATGRGAEDPLMGPMVLLARALEGDVPSQKEVAYRRHAAQAFGADGPRNRRERRKLRAEVDRIFRRMRRGG
jgi:hypothetical protein